MTQNAIVGSILGTAVGDAIGLPYEGLSPVRAIRLLGPAERHRFCFGRGMISDDTEQTCMVAQALIQSGGDLAAFQKSLSWRFRFWLLGVPAGIGLATLRAIIRLWFGFSPDRSGVFSAGNGPAMRAPILGAVVDDLPMLRNLVHASTRITHSDPKAEWGAFAVAVAAQMARQMPVISGKDYLRIIRDQFEPEAGELLDLLARAVDAAEQRLTTKAFAESLGLRKGVSGYVYHTVPVAIHAWLSNPLDFRAAIRSVVDCGGDTDSTAAIVGGIVGAAVGKEGIPQNWLKNLIEWPRTVGWMERLGEQLHATQSLSLRLKPLRLPIWGLLIRNAFFLLVVLFHGFRRLMPPYGNGRVNKA